MMAFCALGRGGVPDETGAAPHAVSGVVLLPRFVHPNSITTYPVAGLHHETPSLPRPHNHVGLDGPQNHVGLDTDHTKPIGICR